MFRRRCRSNVKFRFDRIGRDPGRPKKKKEKKPDAKPEDLNPNPLRKSNTGIFHPCHSPNIKFQFCRNPCEIGKTER